MTSAIIVFASFIVTHTHVRALFSPLVGRSQQIAASLDPTVDTQGWREIAAELDHRGFIGKPGTFIFTSRWYNSGQLACALKQRATVLCYNPGNAHAFAQWSHPESSVGRDGLLVVVDHSSTEPAVYDRWFDQIRPAGEFSVLRSGRPIRRIRLYHCLNQSSPFPSSHSEIALQPVPSPSTSEQVAVRLRQYQSDSSPASRTR
jgi:hypothetical protein